MSTNHQAFARSLHVAGEALQRAARALDAASREPNNTQSNKKPMQQREPASSGFRDDLLTGRQLGAIHAVARKAGLTRDRLAELVHSFGREQITELSRAEASELIDRLQAANTR